MNRKRAVGILRYSKAAASAFDTLRLVRSRAILELRSRQPRCCGARMLAPPSLECHVTPELEELSLCTESDNSVIMYIILL